MFVHIVNAYSMTFIPRMLRSKSMCEEGLGESGKGGLSNIGPMRIEQNCVGFVPQPYTQHFPLHI